MVQAARLANADTFIRRLPQGYQTVLSERGSNLSQGHRPRHPGRPGYPHSRRGHRLSTIRDAGQVLAIHNGEIIETGTHESLLAQKGFYYNLYMSQFKGQVLPDMLPAP